MSGHPEKGTPPPNEALREYWSTGLHPDSPASTRTSAANRLLVSARDAFAANGYRGTTTRDIAAGAGMSPAAMYIHYASKQEILSRLSFLGHRACFESLTIAAGVDGGPRRRLRAVVYDFAHWHAKHHVISRTIQYELHFLDEENYRPVAEVRRQIHAAVEAIVREGVVRGDFAVSDVATTTLAILAMAIDTVRWFPSHTYSDPDQLATAFAELADRLVGGTA